MNGHRTTDHAQPTSPHSGTANRPRATAFRDGGTAGFPDDQLRSAAFRFDRVSKRFGDEPVLMDLTWEGPAGSVIALLGENGAGKTTSLRILMGLESPDTGRAEVLGVDSRKYGREVRRRIGYVAERPALYEWMTVTEIGWFTAGFYPAGFLQEFARLIGGFRVAEHRRVGHLSKGERAKVALALAMAHRPELLILDEPTSGLDPLVRREVLESMADVASAGSTVLVSSHQVQEVERVADVVAILRGGRLAIMGPIDELKRRVRKLTVTWNGEIAAFPDIPGRLLHSERRARQWRLLVLDPDDAWLAALRWDPRVNHLDVRRPVLEEIFAGLMLSEPCRDPGCREACDS